MSKIKKLIISTVLPKYDNMHRPVYLKPMAKVKQLKKCKRQKDTTDNKLQLKQPQTLTQKV